MTIFKSFFGLNKSDLAGNLSRSKVLVAASYLASVCPFSRLKKLDRFFVERVAVSEVDFKRGSCLLVDSQISSVDLLI